MVPRFVLSIDPGIRVCGAAAFINGKLVAAGIVRNPMKRGNGPIECAHMAQAIVDWWDERATERGDCDLPDAVACEWPQIYTQGKLKGDPNDLLALAGVDAALAVNLPESEFKHYLPRDWKGTLSKEVPEGETRSPYEIRLLGDPKRGKPGLLTPEEQARITNDGKKTHNTLDAIGIGLQFLGRFTQTRSFPM